MADITCPQCGTVSEIDEGEQIFCSNCDYPLFWAGRTGEVEDLSAAGNNAGRGEIDTDAQATDIICRNCAERNPGSRTFCQKCGQELTPPPVENFDPEIPPMMAEFPPPRDNSAKILAAVVGVTLFAILIGGGYFGYTKLKGEAPLLTATLDATGDTGFSTSIQFGDGAPAIVYRAADKTMRFIRCTKPDCSAHAATTLVSQGDPGYDAAMDLVGPPLVLYRDQASKAMRAVRCGTFLCDNGAGTRRFNQIDPDDGGYGTSIAVGGGVAIAAYRTGGGAIRVAFLCVATCADTDGDVLDKGSDNARVLTTVDKGNGTPGKPGKQVAIAIPLGGTPYLAYRDEASLTMRLVRCDNRSCSKFQPPITLASGDVGYDPAMIIGRAGFPIVAYRDADKNAVMIVACGDVACSADSRVATVVDNGGEKADKVGFDLEMVPGKDASPVLAYRNDTAGALKVAKCGDAACTGEKRTLLTVDGIAAGSKTGFDISAKQSGGFLYLAYRDAAAKSLRFARVRL